MAYTVYTAGTTVTSTWLNGVGKKLDQWVDAGGDTYTTLADAVTAAEADGKPLRISSGTWAVAANLTIDVPVYIEYGAIVTPAAGITVTFAAGMSAGVYRVFDVSASGASIVFGKSKQQVGYTEWWGAVTNTDTTPVKDLNVIAMNAALVALAKTELMPADYYTNATIKHAVQGHSLSGANCQSFGGTQGFVTNIYCTSATANMLQVGPDAYPGAINSMPQGIRVSDIQLRRTVKPNIAAACAGVKLQWVLKAQIERVFSIESMYSFVFFNTVACRVDKCEARRSLIGDGGGTDFWYGYYANGDNTTVGWGLPGGNASLYLTYCSSSCNEVGLQASGSSGFYFDQQFTDIFMSWCEAGDCHVGINVQGNSATGTSYGNTDLHISRCIIDTARLFGVFIRYLGESGTVDIEGLYCALSGSAVSPAACLYVQDSDGTVNVSGGQWLLGLTTTGRGLVVDTANGVSLIGTQITESTSFAVAMATASNCNIRPFINNAGVTGGPAIQLSGTCAANVIAPMIKGKTNAFTKGIDVVGTTDTRSEYILSGIDSSCLNGGAANKLVRNAVQITAVGITGVTNYVSGVVA